MIKNAIFDWSGTLSDDFVCIYTTITNMFRRLGVKIITPEEFKREADLPFMRFYKKFTDSPRKEIEGIYREEMALVEKPKPFPGVREVLEYPYLHRIRMVILSSNPQDLLEEEVKACGFQKFFIEIKGDAYDKKKVILELLSKNNLITGLPKENLVVGDMVHDVEAGKEMGALTAAITWGHQPKARLIAANPDFLIDDILEIKDIVKRHN